jgi:hypothetical protein
MPENEFTYIKNLLLSIADKQDELSKKQEMVFLRLNNIDIRVLKISQTVIGDETYGHKGLVEQVSDLKKYVEEDKLRNAKIFGGLSVIGIVWTLMFKYLINK